jgi:hypothetical protein
MSITKIQHIELSSAQANITFSNIPQTFTDLLLVVSARTTSNPGGASWGDIAILPNNLTTNGSGRYLFGQGSSASSGTDSKILFRGNSSNSTSVTFGNASIYITNYTSSLAKSFSTDQVSENNATLALQLIGAHLWNSTAAITSLVLDPESASGDFASGSSATLYGVTKGSTAGVSVS